MHPAILLCAALLIAAQHHELKELLETHSEAVRLILAFIESDECRREFLRALKQS
jgi:hypothetical protein